MKNYRYTIKNLDCANCAKKVEDAIAKCDEYKDVTVNFSTSKISLKTEKQGNIRQEIEKIAKSVEDEVEIVEEIEANSAVEKIERNHSDIYRIIIGLIIYFLAIKLPISGVLETILCIISYIILLSKTAVKGFKQITKNRVLDENALIVISVIGAYLVGKEMEGVMVITLYEIGKILEANAVNKTRKSISTLMDIKPEYANLKNGEEYKKVSPKEVQIGDIIVVKTGEKIPLDGIVVKGKAEIDNAALTGESKHVNVQENSRILSGSINVQGLIEIKVEKDYENSTVNQILELVENATDRKAKTETFVSKAAKIYTPIVLGLAILVAIFMPMIFKQVTYNESIYKALIFLVISCPCSIAISVPLSYFSGIGKASKKGILIKGSDYLDGLKDINKIIFDKTGTITTGEFVIKKIETINDSYKEEDILTAFLKGESFSNHPIAKAILKNNDKYIETSGVSEFKENAGQGIEYKENGNKIKIGNSIYVGYQDENIEENTVLYVSVNDIIIGKIVLTDEIKPKTKETIEKLKKADISCQMFTGDKKEAAIKIANQIGIDKVQYEMLPQDKFEKLENEITQNINSKKVAFIGDGINDSPVIARADIGISMGNIGSSSAIEASDVVIMTDELNKIYDAIQISKKTNTIIKQNLIFAIGVKILILICSLIGLTDMWEAVFADVGTTLITIINTLRILK